MELPILALTLVEEVAADDHRLGLGVIDVGRNDGAAARDFVAHEFGRDLVRDRGAEGIAVAQAERPRFSRAAMNFISSVMMPAAHNEAG